MKEIVFVFRYFPIAKVKEKEKVECLLSQKTIKKRYLESLFFFLFFLTCSALTSAEGS